MKDLQATAETWYRQINKWYKKEKKKVMEGSRENQKSYKLPRAPTSLLNLTVSIPADTLPHCILLCIALYCSTWHIPNLHYQSAFTSIALVLALALWERCYFSLFVLLNRVKNLYCSFTNEETEA